MSPEVEDGVGLEDLLEVSVVRREAVVRGRRLGKQETHRVALENKKKRGLPSEKQNSISTSHHRNNHPQLIIRNYLEPKWMIIFMDRNRVTRLELIGKVTVQYQYVSNQNM